MLAALRPTQTAKFAKFTQSASRGRSIPCFDPNVRSHDSDRYWRGTVQQVVHGEYRRTPRWEVYVNAQRIIPTLALLAGVGTAGAVACHMGFEADAARSMLYSLLSPPVARAGESADSQPSVGTGVIRNPFIESQPPSVMPESHRAEPLVAAAQPAPAAMGAKSSSRDPLP